jgi:hypothetical protein
MMGQYGSIFTSLWSTSEIGPSKSNMKKLDQTSKENVMLIIKLSTVLFMLPLINKHQNGALHACL